MTKFTRKQIWMHNGFLGVVAMAKKGMLRIQRAPTVTNESRDLALHIYSALEELYKSLKERAK